MNEGLIEFATRVGIVLGAVVAAITVTSRLWKWGPVAIRSDLDRLNAVVVRLVQVVELQAIIQAEPVESVERAAAISELHRLRRVITSEARAKEADRS